jgi:hypothetical protein
LDGVKKETFAFTAVDFDQIVNSRDNLVTSESSPVSAKNARMSATKALATSGG